MKVRSKSFSKLLTVSEMEGEWHNNNFEFSDIFHIGDRLAWYRAVGYYRTVVGYYRGIAQKRLNSKNADQYLFKTPKNIQIGPIIVENDKIEKRKIFFYRKRAFYLIFLETSDLTTMYSTLHCTGNQLRMIDWARIEVNPSRTIM